MTNNILIHYSGLFLGGAGACLRGFAMPKIIVVLTIEAISNASLSSFQPRPSSNVDKQNKCHRHLVSLAMHMMLDNTTKVRAHTTNARFIVVKCSVYDRTTTLSPVTFCFQRAR